MSRAIVLAIVTIIFACGAAIGFFNIDRVRFNYLAGTVELPLIYLMLLELAFVALIGLAVFAGRVWTLKLEIRGLRKRLAATEDEVKNLRSLTGTPPT
jgi:putative membrane protein